MIELRRTNSENKDFIELVVCLDNYLKTTDGDEHQFYNQYNGIASLNHVVVAYMGEIPIGCGAFKEYNGDKSEIKRMFTKPENRSLGIASEILKELENWSKELSYNKCILETGIRQFEAVSFYKKNNYTLIQNYGQYKDASNSLCFEKILS